MSDQTAGPTGQPESSPVDPEGDEVDPVMVMLDFRTDQPDRLLELLARYVVVSRNQPGCRNIDLVASMTDPERVVVVEKWASEADQRAHFDSGAMVDMARSCEGLLRRAPGIDLLHGVSMHDLA
ncbi:MAG: antibiotic biosynthesis monooxygenase family protein [Acidimicrobiales bacterium]